VTLNRTPARDRPGFLGWRRGPYCVLGSVLIRRQVGRVAPGSNPWSDPAPALLTPSATDREQLLHPPEQLAITVGFFDDSCVVGSQGRITDRFFGVRWIAVYCRKSCGGLFDCGVRGRRGASRTAFPRRAWERVVGDAWANHHGLGASERRAPPRHSREKLNPAVGWGCFHPLRLNHYPGMGRAGK
jgi:hypothetical protein